MSLIPGTHPVVEAALDVMRDAGLLVGDGRKPAGGGWQKAPNTGTFRGYIVVHVFSARYDGTIGKPFDDLSPTLSITGYGDTAAVARQTADMAGLALMTGTWSIPFRDVFQVRPLDDSAADVDDDVQPPLFQDVRRFQIGTTAITP